MPSYTSRDPIFARTANSAGGSKRRDSLDTLVMALVLDSLGMGRSRDMRLYRERGLRRVPTVAAPPCPGAMPVRSRAIDRTRRAAFGQHANAVLATSEPEYDFVGDPWSRAWRALRRGWYTLDSVPFAFMHSA